MHLRSESLSVLISVAFLLLVPAVAAEPASIDQLPCRITDSGIYRVAGDLHFGRLRGSAISVEADDVTIDLNGSTLTGSTDPGTLAVGIQGIGRHNVTITNGRISGFYFGIDLRAGADNPSHSHVVSDVVLSRNYYFGMRVAGADSEVRQCTILDTGGTTRPQHTIPHGVRMVGARNVMRDCRVIDLRLKQFDDGRGEIVGVHFDDAKDAVFERNLVVELISSTDNPRQPDDMKERSFGIWINGGPQNSTFIRVRNNTFVGFTAPVVFSPGSDGQATDNTFYDADKRPVRGKPAIPLGAN